MDPPVPRNAPREKVSTQDANDSSCTYVWLQSNAFKWRVFVVITAIKLLLIPTYRSTDFEVHRNWLAITNSLPIEEWYTNTTSDWTLDYPPLFAWFEWLLAKVAWYADPAMLQIENLNHASNATICFQRGSVIATDTVLALGAWSATRRLSPMHSNIVFFLIVAHPGLLIVDHIHFQYNGLLLGILLCSLGMAVDGKDLVAGLLLAVLVNMKHLFAVLGPVYLVYLFRHHCRGEDGLFNFLRLGTVVLGICALSFGPFIERGQLAQIMSRLFPFGRGLCHAYWAANAWALYAALDKAMALVFRLLNIPADQSRATMTGGLVGTANFALVPDIPPVLTVLFTLLALLPVLVKLWQTPNPVVFVKAVTYASLSSFILGYHVHEKAALTAVIPAALGAVASRRAAGQFIFLSSVSTYALFPLLFTSTEYPIKVLLLLSYTLSAVVLLSVHVHESTRSHQPANSSLLDFWEAAYLSGLAGVELYATWLHPHLLKDRLPFFPLMLISVYCAGGMVYAWAQPVVIEVNVLKRD